MSHALVTGAGGFIGLRLVRFLKHRGDEVTCLAHRPGVEQNWADLDARTVSGDVRRADSLGEALDGVDVVYHLAGRTQAVSTEEFHDVNTRGMENIARASAARPEPPVLVLVSSLAAGGPSQPGRPRTESDPCEPVSEYGRSKLGGELASARIAGDAPISVVRPPFVFGEGDRASFFLFRQIKRWGLHFVRRGGDVELSLVHADDLAEALVATAERGARLDGSQATGDDGQLEQGVYYIDGPQTIPYAEMGRLIGQAFGRRTWKIPIGRPALWTACNAAAALSKITRRPTLLNRDKYREMTAPAWTCSSEKLSREVGYTATKPFAERIQQTADWYLREGWL